MSEYGRCPYPDCPHSDIPANFPIAALRREVSSGWVGMAGGRKGGGVNAIEMVEYTGRVAHAECIKRAKRGLTGQTSLWKD